MSHALPLQNPTPPFAARPAIGRLGLVRFPVARSPRPRAPARLLDPVTGLLNRAGLEEAVAATLSAGASSQGHAALLCVDLGGPDVLARIAAAGGRNACDAVLRAAGAALRSLVRGADAVGRLAGDDFLILLEGLGDLDNAGRVAETAMAALRGLDVAGAGGGAHLAPRIGVVRLPSSARAVASMFAAREEVAAAP